MIDQNEYNEWFKSMLIKHPLDHKFKLAIVNFEGTVYLTVTISHPDDQEKDITISTYGRELTLSIWQHHEHHDSFEDDNHEEEYIKLSEYIDDIINDKVYFAIAYKRENIAYGMASYEYDKLFCGDYDRVEIKTWSGEQDKFIENKA